MEMTAHFRMLAAYNHWANQRIYVAAARLRVDDYLADHGVFFHSVNGTLNHLLVTDRIWLHRLTDDGPIQTRLDEVITTDIGELQRLRAVEDARMVAFADGLSDASLASPLTYRSLTNPKAFSQPLASVLLHIFNHQTHHRGQATAILTRIAGRDACESLDLVVFQRSTGFDLA